MKALLVRKKGCAGLITGIGGRLKIHGASHLQLAIGSLLEDIYLLPDNLFQEQLGGANGLTVLANCDRCHIEVVDLHNRMGV